MPIFGGKLTDVKKRAPNKVPLFLEKSLVYLEHNGLDCEGLFRVSGSLENVRRIKEAIEKGGGDVDYDKTPVRDAHEVAGVIKLYFRELAEPLVPTPLTKEFVSAGANENNSLNETTLKNLLSRLPPDNYAVMKRLMIFLKQLSENSGVTKMTVDNLALVFSPNLIRDSSNGLQEMLMSGHISSVVSFMIGHAIPLFGGGPAAPAVPAPPASLATPPISGVPGSPNPKKPPALAPRKNVSALDLSSYTNRGEFRVGMAHNLPTPPMCLQGCNWGPLTQTGKIAVFTSNESPLVIVVISSDEGKTLAQAHASNVLDTSDSSRYFVVPRSLSPLAASASDSGVIYFGVALYTPEDSITFRTLVDPHRPNDNIMHRATSSGTFAPNAVAPPTITMPPPLTTPPTSVTTSITAPPPTRTPPTSNRNSPNTPARPPSVYPNSASNSPNLGKAPVRRSPSLSTAVEYVPGKPYRKMEHIMLEDEELIVYERIVQLSYANVYRCSLGPLCCMVKIFSKPDEKIIQHTLKEQAIRLKHPNILRALGSQFEENIFCCFYEYCGNNSVWELMYRHKVEDNQLPYIHIKHYASMVARAIVYLHENNTPHRDIKSSNVFLDGDEEPFQVVKLGDVCSSLSLKISWPIMYTSTFPYTPPEILEDSTRTHNTADALKIDIWQFGMLLVELETLGMPFEGLSEEDTQNSILTGKLPPNIPPTSPFLPLIQQCLRVTPQERPSADQVLQFINNLAV